MTLDNERLASIETKVDMLLSMQSKEELRADGIHKELEKKIEESARRITRLERVLYGFTITYTFIVAVGLFVLKKIGVI